MRPLALEPMRRSVLVRMPQQALSVMEPVMGPATEPVTKGSDLKTAPALELRNNALVPQNFDIATGADSSIGDCPSLFLVLPAENVIKEVEVARKLGSKSLNTYARYEQGRTVPTVPKLSELLSAVASRKDFVLTESQA